MTDILQEAASLGVGAFLGLIIFLMYRQDRKATERRIFENAKITEERLAKLLEEDQDTRKDHTKALTELTTLITRLNGRL